MKRKKTKKFKFPIVTVAFIISWIISFSVCEKKIATNKELDLYEELASQIYNEETVVLPNDVVFDEARKFNSPLIK